MKKKWNWTLFLLLALYFVSRIFKLGELPIFIDEVMYINWGRIIAQDAKQHLFISLIDGQQPFFLWMMAIVNFFFKNNLLIFSRMISVLSGLGTVFLLYLIGKRLKNATLGFFSGLIYIFSPFAFWYDRLAIKDTFLLFIANLLFYLSISKKNVKNVLLMIWFSGIGLLTKSISYFFMMLIGVNYFVFDFKKTNLKISNFIKFIYILGGGYLISQLMKFSPLHSLIRGKNQYFILTFSQFFSNPFGLVRNNLYMSFSWIICYISIPVILLILYGILISLRKNKLNTLSIILWGLVPFGFEIFMAKVFFPRYFLIILLPICIFGGIGMEFLFDKFSKKAVIFLLVFAFNVNLISQIYFDLPNAKLPEIERWQYLEGWPSGYGLLENIEFIEKNYLKKGVEVNILTEKNVLTNTGIELYLHKYDNLKIRPVIINDVIFNKSFVDKNSTNLIILSNLDKLEKWPIKKVFEKSRINNRSSIQLFEVDLGLVD